MYTLESASVVPSPTVDLASLRNPIPSIRDTPEFSETVRFFSIGPTAHRSLVAPEARALLFTIVRNMRPEHVYEIGTYMCGTSEAICLALHANGYGMLHTADPFGGEVVPPILQAWPKALRRRVAFYEMDSMAFYMQMEREATRPGVVFVDGNHDYEFASFDIQCAARRLLPGGFIFVDNAAQAGPFLAASDFLALHPHWYECGNAVARHDPTKSFDKGRTGIRNTDLIVLRAPQLWFISRRPTTFGDVSWHSNTVLGLRVPVLETSRQRGHLHVQCILRGFRPAEAIELIAEASIEVIGPLSDIVDVRFNPPLRAGGGFDRFSVETWFIWDGRDALRIGGVPSVF